MQKDFDAVYKRHEKHVRMIDILKNILFRADFKLLDDITSQVCGYDLIIIMGGDNSFTRVSHFANGIPILPVNAYPESSYGCLTRWTISDDHDVYDMAEALDFYEFDVEDWPQLEATIDGTPIVSSISEYFLGEKLRNKMSKNIIGYKDKEYYSRSSGIIVATGAGSTGWYSSVARTSTSWEPKQRLAAFVVSEPFTSKPIEPTVLTGGEILDWEELIIESLNKDGMMSSDSWECFPFPHGCEARIYLGKPLHIVVPRKKK